MKKIVILGIILMCLAFHSKCLAEEEKTIFMAGYFRGHEYLKLSERERLIYAAGLLDGMHLGSFIVNNETTWFWLKACTKGSSNAAIEQLLSNYLRNYPLEWDDFMNLIFYRALRKDCPHKREDFKK